MRYEAKVSTKYAGVSVTYVVTTENGVQTFTGGTSFNQTFGPVNKGFKASINVYAKVYDQPLCNAKISVCRGNEPFALKAHNSGRETVSTSYTINY